MEHNGRDPEIPGRPAQENGGRVRPSGDEAVLQAIIESLNDAVMAATPDFVITRWNGASERIYGYTAEEAIGMSLLDTIPEGEHPHLRHIFRQVQEGHTVAPYDGIRIGKGGRRFHVSVTISPALPKGPQGEVAEVLAVIRDITEQRLAEERIRKSEKQLRELADVMPQIVWRTDAQGNVTYFNRRWREYTGVPHWSEMGTEEWVHFIHPEDRQPAMERWAFSISHGTPFQCECRLRNTDGEYRVHLARAVAMRNEQGEITHWYGTSTDVDDMKRIHRQLEWTDQRKDQFIAMLAHELRNPLAVVDGAVRMMSQPDTPERRERGLTIIRRNVKRLARMVDDLLDVSRVVRGKVQLHRETVDLRSVLHNTLEGLRTRAPEAADEVEMRLPPDPVWTWGDPSRLEQIFANLLNNAVRYTPRGNRISVSLTVALGRGWVSVKDEGVGIQPDLLPHIFEAFSQGDSTLARTEGGLGLGLKLVRGLTEMHGGNVTAFSAGPGLGSEFTVSLPLYEAAFAPASRAPSETGKAVRGRGQRVLVVDDNRELAESTSSVLESAGYGVARAFTGADALALAKEFRPLAVLLDIGLPDMDGYEVARRIREDAALGSPLLIAVSGYGQRKDRQLSREAGIHVHLIKPLDFDQLFPLLARGLS